MPRKIRDYAKERASYDGKPEVKARNAKRTKLRRLAIKEGLAKRGDGKDLDHKVPLSKGGSNSLKNVRKVDPKTNRSYSRNKDGSIKSTAKRKKTA